MSNAIRPQIDEIYRRFDPAFARRQFTLSLVVGLAVLAAAAMSGLQPARTTFPVQNARHRSVSAPEFVVMRSLEARRPAGFGALASMN